MVTVQFGAAPPNTIFAVGNKVPLDEVTLKFADVQSSKLSTSLIVNPIAAVAVSSAVV